MATKPKGMRQLANRVKTAKGRKISSTDWIRRHINDKYVIMAKEQKLRSRAAFKLLEIIEKFGVIKKANFIVDLGCAPGGWLQVLQKKTEAKLIGVDLVPMDPIEGVGFICGDFLDSEIQKECIKHMGDHEKFDVILSDMAAKSCGNPSVDHLRIMELADYILEFAATTLRPGGNLVFKILKGGEEHDLHKRLNLIFDKVKYFKPEASYKDSAESYVIALGYKKV